MTLTRPTYDPVLERSPEDDESEPRMLCRHDDAVAAAHDPITYSSAVSRFLQIPNGLDGDVHRAARDLFDPFFVPDRMDTLEPVLVTIAEDLVQSLPQDLAFDAVQDVGARFAVRAQSAWLGWPASIEQELLDWMDDNHRATRSGDLARTTLAAEHFDAIIQRLVVERRAPDPSNDVTTELVQLRDGNGRPLADEVLVSVPLASLELRIITRALLQVGRVLPALEPPQRELPPLGGFSTVPIRINPR